MRAMRRVQRLAFEAHRRYVWQVLVVYAIAAWLGYRLVLVLYARLGLHDWVPPFAAVLFIIGIPILAATAFINRRLPRRDDLLPPPPEPLPLPEYPYDVPYAGGATVPLAPETGPGPLLSWRRSLAMGVVAFALLGLGATSFVGMRHLGLGPAGTLVSRGTLQPGAEVVLADFAVEGNATADGAFARAVTEALRLDLSEASVIRVVESQRVNRVAARLQRESAPAITPEVAQAAALLLGSGAVITGDVVRRGDGFLLRAHIGSADGARVHAAWRESAQDSADVLDAVDRLARRIRADVGESLRTTRAAVPLAVTATASLPAFIHYAASLRAAESGSDIARAAEQARAAVALDPSFALAWLRLGTLLLHDGGDAAGKRHALTRAYELRDRLGARDRLLVEAIHAHHIVRDAARAVPLYEAVLALAPLDAGALHGLPLALIEQRRFQEAEAPLAAAIEAGLGSADHWTNLVAVQFALGRPEEARATLERARESLPDDRPLRRLEATFATATGDWRGAGQLTRAWAARAPAPLPQRATFQLDLWQVGRAEGRLGEATRHLREADVLLARLGRDAARYRLRLAEAEMTALTRLDRPGAVRLLEELEQQFPLESLALPDRPYLPLAEAWAWAGEPDRAQALLDAFEEAGLPPAGDEAPAFTRGVIELARGDVMAAVASLRSYTGVGACTICGLPVLGHALEGAGEPAEALAAYERYLTTPYLMRRDSDATWRAFVLGRAAELHEQLGQRAQALERYAEFARLWQHADAELQPQVQSARRRINALQRSRR